MVRMFNILIWVMATREKKENGIFTHRTNENQFHRLEHS